MSLDFPGFVKLVEVGPRDGLQNESTIVSADIKIDLINRLSRAGFKTIEAGAFVSPKWVPQMATSEAVLKGLTRYPGVTYAALVPNMKGLEAALLAHTDEIVIFTAASEAFSQKNTNCSIAASIERFIPVAEATLAAGKKLRASVSCAMGCPYQGKVDVQAVVDVAKQLYDLGCHEIDIADTIGVGTPRHVQSVLERVGRVFPLDNIAGHFHDTYGQAVANIYASLEVGISTFHTSLAGLGGCPYAKGATGNVATEDVLFLMQGLGIETGIDIRQVIQASEMITAYLGKASYSRAGVALNKAQ